MWLFIGGKNDWIWLKFEKGEREKGDGTFTPHFYPICSSKQTSPKLLDFDYDNENCKLVDMF